MRRSGGLSMMLALTIALLGSFPMTGSGLAMNDTELHAAAAGDDAATIRTLIARGAAIDARDRKGLPHCWLRPSATASRLRRR
jgi:hypothetical protein